MSQFSYLLLCEDAEDLPALFTADGALAKPGDYVAYEGELFPVKESLYIDKESPEYAMISQLASIHEADAIFCANWTKQRGYNV